MQYLKDLHHSIEKPQGLLPWLLNQQSMTDKLKKETKAVVTLSVLRQWWGPVGLWEKNVLQMKASKVFRREIRVSAGSCPCWFARTVVANSTYQNYEGIFQRLERESLGEIIFSDKRIQRHSLISYPINDQCMEYYWLGSQLSNEDKTELWIRLSEFSIEGSSFFYLMEILLPGLLTATEAG